MTIFSLRKTAHRCIVRVTQSNWVRNTILCFPVLPGSAELEAQVVWGGIVKCLLIAYFIGNISAKKYQNLFMCVKVIANQGGTFFETRCRDSDTEVGMGIYHIQEGITKSVI